MQPAHLLVAGLLVGAARSQNAEFGISKEEGDAFGIVETTVVGGAGDDQGVPAHTTYRLALRIVKNAANVYTIFGREKEPMSFPPAFQVKTPFGVNIGGVNPQFFSMGGAAKYAAYDSWLTVGMTSGATGALGVVGDDMAHWTEKKGLSTQDGAVFWMNPSHGPGPSDTNGQQGKLTPSGDITIAQLTVKTGSSFDARINCQGHTKNGGSWEATDIRFRVSPAEEIARQNGRGVCTNVQLAAVHGCVANCKKCKSELSILSRLCIAKDGHNSESCVTTAGESAIDTMKLAVCECGGNKGRDCGHPSATGDYGGDDATENTPPPPPSQQPPPPPTPPPPPSKSAICRDAVSASMIMCCAPTLRTSSVDTRVLLFTCMAASKQPGKMCEHHGCVASLSITDKACGGPGRLEHSTAEVYNQLRDYVKCGTKQQLSRCTDFAEMNAFAKSVNKECCSGPGERCSHGFPSKCDAGCAAALEPMKQHCGKFLSDMSPTVLHRLEQASKLCPKPCDDFGKFHSALTGLSHYCCGGKGEHCQAGVPSTCDAECGLVLPAFADACHSFLQSPMNVGIKNIVDKTLKTCAAPGSRFGGQGSSSGGGGQDSSGGGNPNMPTDSSGGGGQH